MNTRTTPLSRAGGFTLMEILIAIAVIVVGLVGVVAVFPVALHDVQVNQDESISAQLAQSVKSALRAGFANAKFDGDAYFVPLIHPGRRPDSLPPVSSPGSAYGPELLDYLRLPARGDEQTGRTTFYPANTSDGWNQFYTLSYEEQSDDLTSQRAYGQSSLKTSSPGATKDNGFQNLRDPYAQYGFNIELTPMENTDNLFMVGIRVSRNPLLYTQIGGGRSEDGGLIKELFFTILAVR